ncbi:MAG: DNA (cytosine-5-)-methyltransferase [Synechococcales cyanobacterium RM1_1_8]|nr:DNA (cytosine-5-)-methyltransferase [Synechococcales cyanobacterium RM1_1_8]
MKEQSARLSVYKNEARKEYNLSPEQREEYRRTSHESRMAKLNAVKRLHERVHVINTPLLDPLSLMPQLDQHGLTALSLFSGGGGLDLGVSRAGYRHIASYELIPICKETLRLNCPDWKVYGGPEEGDVTQINWQPYVGEIDVIHGGPPCQPFSIAGEQKGLHDERNMWGEFNRAVNTIKPSAFIAENVLGLLNPKFNDFVKKFIIDQLSEYSIVKFEMHAADFGVPQVRRRVFFVGFRKLAAFKDFKIPQATHSWRHLQKQNQPISLSLFEASLPKTMGVREALGLTHIDYDALAPTIRSGFTGKRNTTSILNSSAGQKSWGEMKIWPNGVQESRESASAFPAKHQHFRLSIQDVALLQGFPESWHFSGAVYQRLGQIGNSVVPPVAYHVAKNVLEALES